VACQNGHVELVEILLNGGSNPNAQDLEGATPMMKAGMFNHKQCVELLLAKGAKKNLLLKTGYSCFQVCMHMGHTEVAQLVKF
jgi:ankyrin repeat protein